MFDFSGIITIFIFVACIGSNDAQNQVTTTVSTSPSIPKDRPSYCNTPGAAIVNPECGKASTQQSSSSPSGASPKPTVPMDHTITPGSTTKQENPTTNVVEITPEDFPGPPVINYFGVAFSPYVREGALFNSYTLQDIMKMLEILSTNHNIISTYGIGVESYNKDNPWDETDSNCLISRAAAMINNKDRKGRKLSIFQGINQHKDSQELQEREIENAFSAVADANSIFPETVRGLIFTNEYIDKCEDCGQRVLEMINKYKSRALEMELLIGTRTHICEQINGGPYQKILKDVAKESHFIMCNLYPPANSSNVDRAIAAISNAYFHASDGIWEVNPDIEVIIGETGWASEGQTYNPPDLNTIDKEKEFWMKMKKWATKNQVKILMFEAFDEPWKLDPDGERKYGWWFYDGIKYIEKATGKEF